MQFQQRRGRFSSWLSIAIVACATMAVAATFQTTPPPKQSASQQSASKPPHIRDAYGRLPLSFEENRGQTDAQVKFLARGGGYSLFLTPTEAVLKLRAPSSAKKQAKPGAMPIAFHPASIEPPKFSVVRIRLEGANPNSTASGVEALPGHSNYFIGKDRAKWHTGIATYGGVRFESIYPGINLVYRGTQGRLEYDFVIAPHADPSRIKMNLEGADALSLDGDGNLVIKTAGGEVIQKAPVIYQESHGARHPVAGGYSLTGKHSVTFKLASYDRSAPLIIDPLLTYVSYLGGSGSGGDQGDQGIAIAVDSTGAAVVTGFTLSTDFPVTSNAFQPNYFGNTDVFITKVSPDGSTLIYSTYAGGSGVDQPNAMALDVNGNAYVTGRTFSTDYPVSAGAYQTTFNNGGGVTSTIFLTALDSEGDLIYSTFLGQTSSANAIAVNEAGEAWLTGVAGGNFPTTSNALQPSCSVNCSFLTKVNSSGTGLIYSALFGPYAGANHIALDGNDNLYLSGGTIEQANFPTHGLCGYLLQGCGFFAKMSADGSSVIFAYSISSYPLLGASATDIAVNKDGSSHLLLSTADVSIIVNFNPDGTGGSPSSYEINHPSGQGLLPLAIALDPFGNIFVTGFVINGTELTTTPGAFQASFGGQADAFLTELDPTGNLVLYSSYLGGSGSDSTNAIAADGFGNAYITGFTNSNDFPVTSGVFQPTLGAAEGNAFVARINPDLPPTPTATTTATPTLTATPTGTPTGTPTPTPMVAPTAIPTIPRTPISTRAPQPTGSPEPTAFGGGTPAATATSTLAATTTMTMTPTITVTPTPTATATPVGSVNYSPKNEELKFPTRKVNTTSAVKFVTVSNPKRNKAAVLIAGVALQSPGSSGFNLNTLKTSCIAGHPIEAGKSCRVAIYFAPKATGASSDTLSITGNMTNKGSIALTGAGR